MPPTRPHFSVVRRAQGVLAGLLAGLILALGLLSVLPEAHAHLHHSEDDSHHEDGPLTHDDSGCAVALFQQGVTPSPDLPGLPEPQLVSFATVAPTRVPLALSAPRHLLRPARGPPV